MKNAISLVGRSAATIILVILAALVAIWLWRHYERDPWTRDGRVRADVVRITPDVSGLVTSVAVHDNQTVSAGQLLFVIDRPRYTLALRRALASLASARAVLDQARKTAARDRALGDLVAAETTEEDEAKVRTAEASLAEAQAAVAGAELDLKRTNVRASVNGVVSNLDLHPGDYVAEGRQAMALIDTGSLRVEGYFEETKLPAIRIGAPVVVHLMGEPRPLHGVVESVAAGINDPTYSPSGNLLPNVEASFSWVRLAQRIPVRVRITQVPPGMLLVAGRTATVTIEPPQQARMPAVHS